MDPTPPETFRLFERYREIIDDWDAFVAAAVRPLPVCVWGHPGRVTPRELRRILEKEGWEPEAIDWYPGAFRLPPHTRPGRSLAYLTGLYHVQEEASLVPVELLDPQPGDRVLDLCAAPGNKTLQIALRLQEMETSSTASRGTVVANDRSSQRMGPMLRGIERMGVENCAVLKIDAGNLPRQAGLFDRVLADVPCSCHGTSRKSPGILQRGLRRHPEHSRGMQTAILKKAVLLCRPGGRVVYSTCTYAPQENELVIDAVLREFPGELRLLPAHVEGLRCAPGLQEWRGQKLADGMENTLRLYPHHNDTGGFFVAVLERAIDAALPEARLGEPRTVVDTVEAVDSTLWRQGLEEHFGFPASTFAGRVVFRPGNKRLSIVDRGLELPQEPLPHALGMPFFHPLARFPRLTTSAVLRFGSQARRHLLDVDEGELEALLRRQPLEMAVSRVIDGDGGDGYVIVRHGERALGFAVALPHDDGLTMTVHGNLPRRWAKQVYG